MDRREFLLGSLCAALAGFLGLPGAGLAAASLTDADRILRLTKRGMQRMRLIEPPEMVEIVNNQRSRYVIVSLQSIEEYVQGHIPGALWLPYLDLVNPAKAEAILNKLPKSKPIVLTCSNGHLSCAVSLYLRQLGYTTFPLAFGMDRWNRAYAGTGAYPGDINGPLTADVVKLELDANFQHGRVYAESTDSGLIKAVTASCLPGDFESIEIKPASFSKEFKSHLLLCLMRPEDYAKQHIPGAVNLPGEAFNAGDELLLWLPRNKKIVLSCYVGHFSCGACLLLRQLGYDAYTLYWGMAGWNKQGVPGIAKLLEAEMANPVETGPGSDVFSL